MVAFLFLTNFAYKVKVAMLESGRKKSTLFERQAIERGPKLRFQVTVNVVLLLRICLRYFKWFFILAFYFTFEHYVHLFPAYIFCFGFFRPKQTTSRWHFVFCGSPFCRRRSHMSRGRLSPVPPLLSRRWVESRFSVVVCLCVCARACTAWISINSQFALKVFCFDCIAFA